MPSPLREFELALPNTGPVLEGSALGKCRSRISRGLSASHLSALPFSFVTGRKAESWLIPQPHSLTLLSAGHQNKATKTTCIPGKPSPGFQKQKGTYEGVLILDDACTQLKG